MAFGLDRRELRAWALYDWANSAFVTTVGTAVFPVYFARLAEAGGLTPAQSTARFALGTAIGLALIAVLAPPLGVLSDRRPIKKRMLGQFLVVGVLATAALSLIEPGAWRFALVLFVLGNVALSATFVFYDALLPHIARADEVDQVSSAGYALGYLGGGVLLALNLLWIQKPEWFHLSGPDAAVRLSFASVALWWLGFSLPLFRTVAEPPVAAEAPSLRRVFRDLLKRRQALLFLAAFLIYNDGIGTIIRLATTYGAELGIRDSALIGAVLLVQFLGVPATFAFGQLARSIGPKAAILIALGAYGLISVVGYFMRSERDFYLLAALVALVQGGCQALSRSLFASFIPAARSAEFFALFSVFDKFAAILGPLVFSAALLLGGSSRAAILAIAGFFAVGAILLARVDVEAGRREASN